MGASLELTGGDRRIGVTWPTMGLGGMVQQSAADGCMWMDELRLVALYGVMVMSMADRTSKVYAMIPPEDGTTTEDGSGVS